VNLGKQGITSRGKIEDITSQKNSGNFIALLKSYDKTDGFLFNPLYHMKANTGNAGLLFPTTQSNIINNIEYYLILADIISEAKQADNFSVLADELSCHNMDMLCWQSWWYQRRFLSFIKLERVRYDGASTMSGKKAGVQARIK